MRLRAVFLESVILLLWAFICFIYLRVIGFNIFLSVIGVISGLVFGSVVALKYISSLEKEGEVRVNLRTLVFLLLITGILISISLLLLFNLGVEVGIQMVSFIYPFVPAVYAARVVLYSNWERKHGRLILFDGFLLGRVYAVPKTGERG